MSHYSKQIPWVLWAPFARHYEIYCQVCGANAQTSEISEVHAFARHHSVHSAGPDHLGLGDAVARLAKPIAAALGQEPCTPCEARRRALNAVRVRRPW